MKLIVNWLIKLGILKKDLDYHLIRISRRLQGFCITKILPPDANQNSIRMRVNAIRATQRGECYATSS